MLRCFMTIKFESSMTLLILEYTVTTLAIVLFTLIMLFIVRLFNICMPTDLIPWCQPVSKIIYLNVLFRCLIVGCVVIDSDGLYTLIEVICLFVVQGALALYRLFFSPQYSPDVDFMQKTQDFLVLMTLFFSVVCMAVTDTRNYDLIYIVCFAPLSTLGWKIFERYRNRQIIQRMK